AVHGMRPCAIVVATCSARLYHMRGHRLKRNSICGVPPDFGRHSRSPRERRVKKRRSRTNTEKKRKRRGEWPGASSPIFSLLPCLFRVFPWLDFAFLLAKIGRHTPRFAGYANCAG